MIRFPDLFRFVAVLILGVALVIAGLAGIAAAGTDDFVIAAGKPGGGYDKRARQIEQRLEQRGIPAEVLNFNGSDEISLAVCAGRASIGIMQIDAIYARSLEGCQMKAVGSYGAELALILFPPRSAADQLSDLGPGSAVMVDTIGSGAELFWRTIVRIETGEDGDNDAWASARAVNDPMELANTAAEMGEIDAVIVVQKPDATIVQSLIGQGWTVGELWDRDIGDLVFNGGALYRAEEFGIPAPGGKKTWAWGYEVRSFIVVPRVVADGDRLRFAAITAAAQ